MLETIIGLNPTIEYIEILEIWSGIEFSSTKSVLYHLGYNNSIDSSFICCIVPNIVRSVVSGPDGRISLGPSEGRPRQYEGSQLVVRPDQLSLVGGHRVQHAVHVVEVVVASGRLSRRRAYGVVV